MEEEGPAVGVDDARGALGHFTSVGKRRACALRASEASASAGAHEWIDAGVGVMRGGDGGG